MSDQELIREAKQHISYSWTPDGDKVRTGRLVAALELALSRIATLTPSTPEGEVGR